MPISLTHRGTRKISATQNGGSCACQSHPSLPEAEAKTGPAKSAGRDLRRLAAVAVLGAGLLALGLADRVGPRGRPAKAGVPAETLSFANIVEQVKPAVVSISTTNDVPKVADEHGPASAASSSTSRGFRVSPRIIR